MDKLHTSRRQFLELTTSAGVAAGSGVLGTALAQDSAQGGGVYASLGDERILIEFDQQLRSRVSNLDAKAALTEWGAGDVLVIGKDSRVDQFALQTQSKMGITGLLGRGTQLRLTGVSATQIEKTVELQLLADYPGFAIQRVSFRNAGTAPVRLSSWTQCGVRLPHLGSQGNSEPVFWSFCGSTHADRRDWVQPVRVGFEQKNFMGMVASDYGGGTPIVDVWRASCGIGVGHLETTPLIVSLPVKCMPAALDLCMTAPLKQTLQPGERLNLPLAFVATHSGDYFAVLDAYRRIMALRGIASPRPPAAAYEAIWCAWGYERQCSSELVEGTLPKVRELGLRWAVVDDGWQTNVGDWKLDPRKYPRGDEDMRSLVRAINSHDLKARLWWAPLAAAPGSDLLHDHSDMLLLGSGGELETISWWNCLYLCPAYQPTVDYMAGLVRKFLGEWGYAGLKIDGQHLNAVAPCHNPAHKHARPEESLEKLQDFYLAIYRAAMEVNPQAVIELCPCGTSYSFFNFKGFNTAPASDPESSWQVRHKGKTLKALMGPSAAYAGDHVELTAGGNDFASQVGVGGIVSTKFTWPRDPKPKDSFLLTPEREAVWRRWISLYNQLQLPLGTYRGELYDIGFDKPETHVIEKAGRLYYAFYASEFSGQVPLRGLTATRYRVRDYYNDRDLGEVSRTSGRLQVAFSRFLVLEATPL